MEIAVNLRQHQANVFDELKRFNVLLGHRRFGKSVLAVWLLIVKTLSCPLVRPRGYYLAPTYAQAKKVAWDYLKAFSVGIPGVEFNESELKASYPGGAVIHLGSADNPDSNRGVYADFVVLDEPAQMPSRIWTEVMRPALSDRHGGALFIGTPAGRNGLFFDVFQQAADDPEWGRWTYRASETAIVEHSELVSAQRSMSQSEYQQEYECSFDAAIRGSYYGAAMDKATVGNYPADQTKLVHIALDLGIGDATAAWFFQIDGAVPMFVDHAEYTNMGLPDIVADWRLRGYQYGKVLAPHDINVRSLSTGATRLDTMRRLGCDVLVAPKLDLMDGIEMTRQLLQRSTFHAAKCGQGIEALRQYRADWQDKKNVLALRPVHDWSSHTADAMRTLAQIGLQSLQDQWQELDYSAMDKAISA